MQPWLSPENEIPSLQKVNPCFFPKGVQMLGLFMHNHIKPKYKMLLSKHDKNKFYAM